MLRAHVTRVMYMDAPAVGRPVFEAQPAPEPAPEWAGHGPAPAHGEPGDRGELHGPEGSDGGYLLHPLVPGQVTANLLVRPGLVFHRWRSLVTGDLAVITGESPVITGSLLGFPGHKTRLT